MKDLIKALDGAIGGYKAAIMIAERFPTPENLIKAHNRKQSLVDIATRIIEENAKQ